MDDFTHPLIAEMAKKFPIIPVKSMDDAELLEDAQNYQSLYWCIIEELHWNLMRSELRATRPKPKMYNGWYLYYKHLPVYLEAFKNPHNNSVYLWIWVSPLKGKEDIPSPEYIFFEEVFKFLPNTRQGLISALNPNEGGLWNEETQRAAEIIMYG